MHDNTGDGTNDTLTLLEMNIETKDTKIFMYEQNKKVNIKSKN